MDAHATVSCPSASRSVAIHMAMADSASSSWKPTASKEIDEDPDDYLGWWNLLDQTDITLFRKKIGVLREHIEKMIQTPMSGRGEPEFKL